MVGKSRAVGVRRSSRLTAALWARRASVLAAAVGGVALFQQAATATDYTWTGPGAATPAADGNWDDPNNWTPDDAPGFPSDIILDRATFSIGAQVPVATPVELGTVVSLNNGSRNALRLTFSNPTGTYRIENGGAAGVLNLGAEGIDHTSASTNGNEILAQVLATTPSTWYLSNGTLRFLNVGLTTAQNNLSGATINLGKDRAGAVTNAGTLQGTAVAGSSSLNGATLDVTGNNVGTFAAPTLRLVSGETTTLGGITVHGGINFNPDNNHKLAGPINVDADAQVRWGGAQAFRPQGTVTLAGTTTMDVSGNWTFLNGPQNWGGNTVTKTGGGELQLVGFVGAPPAALPAGHVVTGTINVNAGAFISGANATINSLGTAVINAGGGNLRLRPFAATATDVPMDNAVNVVNANLQIQVDNATLGDVTGSANNQHIILGSAARPVTLGSATDARTLNISPVARQHDLTIPLLVLNNNGTINVDVDNEVTGNPGAPAADRNVVTIQNITQDATNRNLTKTGPDTLVLNAATYAGTTTVSNGTLQLGSSAVAPGTYATSGVTLATGGGLRYVAPPTATSGIPFNLVTNNAGRIEISYPNADLSSLTAAQLSDAGDTLRLSADQDTTAGAVLPAVPVSRFEINANIGGNYDGVAVTDGGTVATPRAAQTYASDLTLNGNVTFDTGGGNLTVTGNLNGQGTTRLTKAGNNSLILRGTNTYGGGTEVRTGNLNANAGAAVGSGPVAVNGTGLTNLTTGATFQIDPGAGNTFTLTGERPVTVNNGIVHALSGVADLGGNPIVVTPFLVTTTTNALEGRLFNNSTGRGIDGANINANVFNAFPTVSRAFTGATGAAAGQTPSGTLDFNNDNDFSNFFSGTTNGPPGGTNFTAAFVGRFTPGVTGVHTFGTEGNDDRATLWIDLDQDGVFELDNNGATAGGDNEMRVNDACCNAPDVTGTATLTANQNYNVVFVVEDTGGGSGLGVRYQEPAGGQVTTLSFVDPNAPEQAGRFSYLSQSGGGTVRVASGADLRTAAITGATNTELLGGATPAAAALLRLTGGAAPNNASDTANLTLAGATTPFGTVEVGANHIFSATSLAIANGGTLTKTGPGVLNINGAPGAGTGSLVVAQGTLGGIGSVLGPVLALSGATVSPGLSPGILSVGGIDLADGSNFVVELNGLTVGTQYDQLNVTGAVDLGAPVTGPNLSVVLGYVPSLGDTFTIINNDGADPVVGTFAQGLEVIAGGTPFTINYAGGDGNDVTLTAVPEPASAGLLALGALGLLARRRRRA